MTIIRVLVCGFIAGVVWTAFSILVVALVGADFFASIPHSQPDSSSAGLLALLSNFVAAIWAIWLYIALSPRFRSAAKRAVIAGLAWWIIQSNQSLKWTAVVGLPISTGLPLLFATLPAMIASVAAGAWVYHFDLRRQAGSSRGSER